MQQCRPVKLVRGRRVGDIDDVDGEARGHPVVRKVGGEVAGVCLGIGAGQALLFRGVASGIDQGMGSLGLATEGVDFDEVDIA